MNAAWTAWADPANLPARATVEAKAGRPAHAGRDYGDLRQIGAAISARSRRDHDEERKQLQAPDQHATVHTQV